MIEPSKKVFALVEIWFGNPETFHRLTNLPSEVVSQGKVWSPLPQMDIALPEETLEVILSNLSVTMPKQSWMSTWTSGVAVPRIDIKVYEVLEVEGSQFGTERSSNVFVITDSSPNAVITQTVDKYLFVSDGTQCFIEELGILEEDYTFQMTYTIASSVSGSLVLISGVEETPLSSAVGTHTVDFVARGDDLHIENDGVCNIAIEAIGLKKKAYDQPSTTLVLFKGRLQRIIDNYQGESGLIKIEASHLKGETHRPLGFIATEDCGLTFGDEADSDCGIELIPLREQATVTGISGKTITVSGLVTTTDDYFTNGYIELSGLRTRIVESTSSTVFELSQVPPATWNGIEVVFTPGCLKRHQEDCIDKWNNESQFSGMGIGTPAYDPRLAQG